MPGKIQLIAALCLIACSARAEDPLFSLAVTGRTDAASGDVVVLSADARGLNGAGNAALPRTKIVWTSGGRVLQEGGRLVVNLADSGTCNVVALLVMTDGGRKVVLQTARHTVDFAAQRAAIAAAKKDMADQIEKRLAADQAAAARQREQDAAAARLADEEKQGELAAKNALQAEEAVKQLAAEKAEKERLAAEVARLADEKKQAALAAEQQRAQAESDKKLAADQAEQERLEAGAARLAEEKKQADLVAARASEAEDRQRQQEEADKKFAAERMEKERLAAEVARLAEEKKQAELAAEQQRLSDSAEKARLEEAARLADEKNQADLAAEKARVAEENRHSQEEADKKLAAEKAEKDELAAEVARLAEEKKQADLAAAEAERKMAPAPVVQPAVEPAPAPPVVATLYAVSLSGPESTGHLPKMWDADKHKLVEVSDRFAVFQDLDFSVSVSPSPPSDVRYEWAIQPAGFSTRSPNKREMRARASAAGTYVVTADVRDDHDAVLGSASTSVTVAISSEDLEWSQAAQEADVQLTRARALVAKGQLDEGLELAAEAAKLDPKSKDAREASSKWSSDRKAVLEQLALARTWMARMDYDRAHTEWARAEAVASRYVPVRDLEDELQSLKKTLDRAQGLVNDGYALEKRGKDAAAIAKYEAALKLVPDDKLAVRVGELKSKVAESDAQKLIDEGYALEKGGDIAGAIACYEKTYAIFPDDRVVGHVRELQRKP